MKFFARHADRPTRRRGLPTRTLSEPESLEPRWPLAATVGTQAFGTAGTTTVNTGDINTATLFTMTEVLSAADQTGYFRQNGGLPAATDIGTWSFDIGPNPQPLIFSSPFFGTFRSSEITTESNTVVPGKQRTFYVLGTLSGGTLGPLTPSPAPSSITITLTQTGAAISSSATLTIPPTKAKSPLLVAANDIGCDSSPLVYVVDPFSGVSTSFNPYRDYVGFRGGVRVAVGNVDADPNTLEIITAPGPGRVAQVRVFKLDPLLNTYEEDRSFRFLPFGPRYVRGVDIAAGDVDGDGIDDLVAGASRGQGAVAVARSTTTTFVSQPAKSFTAFGGTYTGGASVAVQGVGRIVVGSGVGLQPTVRIFDVSGTKPRLTGQFAPQVPGGTGGVTVNTQFFTATGNPQVLVAGGRNADSAVGNYKDRGNPPTATYAAFAGRARPNAPVYAAAAALSSGLADTVFMAQGFGGVNPILKVAANTGVVDPTFVPTLNGRPIVAPLRIATRVSR